MRLGLLEQANSPLSGLKNSLTWKRGVEPTQGYRVLGSAAVLSQELEGHAQVSKHALSPLRVHRGPGPGAPAGKVPSCW